MSTPAPSRYDNRDPSTMVFAFEPDWNTRCASCGEELDSGDGTIPVLDGGQIAWWSETVDVKNTRRACSGCALAYKNGDVDGLEAHLHRTREARMRREHRGLHWKRVVDASAHENSQREKIFAEQWAEQNIKIGSLIDQLAHIYCEPGAPGSWRPMDGTVSAVRNPLGHVVERDRVVAATIAQWFGTNVGFSVLEEILMAAGYELRRVRKD